MKQVFVNLLINAKHACDDLRDQQGKIRVKLFANENNIYIEVADNGCGMDADTLKQMFAPFFTTKPVGQGTGMGMAIVYNVLKEHNGTIEVEDSNEDDGFSFGESEPHAHYCPQFEPARMSMCRNVSQMRKCVQCAVS